MPAEKNSDEFFEMVQRFIHLRPKMVVPDHIARFKQQMQNCKPGGAVNPEDRAFIFRIFIILERNETPPTMGELSTELEIPLSSATRIIDGLVSAKFIERVHDLTDRRVVRVQMSKTGKEFYQTAREFNKKRITRMLDNFSPEEKAQLLYLMNKLFDAMTAEAEINKGAA